MKYPRTPHLPFSPGKSIDRQDKVLPSISQFVNTPVVITEKLDGSNVALTNTHVYARSHSAAPSHPSFDALKRIWAGCRHEIPEGLIVYGEWCYAVHTLRYPKIGRRWLNVFGCYLDKGNEEESFWLDWDAVKIITNTLDLNLVPVRALGQYSSELALEKSFDNLSQQPSDYGPTQEGLVIRPQSIYKRHEFAVAKWVRKDHVQGEHWSKTDSEKQGLAIVPAHAAHLY